MIATLVLFGGATRRCRGWPSRWRGARSSAARCSSPCSCPSCCRVAPDLRSRSIPASDARAHRRRATSCRCSSAAASCRSAPTSTRCSRASADGRGRPGWPTRRCCTRCRSACSACRCRRPNCRRCRALARRRRGRDRARFARRLDAGLRQIAFFVVPSAVAFLALGDVIAAALLQTGRFGHDDAVYVWGILAGSAVGSAGVDARPAVLVDVLRAARHADAARYALVRVVLTTVLGYLFAIPLPRWLGVAPAWGAAGLTASAGIAGWVEMLLLRRSLNARIGRTGLPAGLRRQALGVGTGGGGRGVGRQTDVLPAASDPGGVAHPRTVRHRVSVRDGRARRSGSEKRPRVAEPRSAKALAERRRLP